MLNKSIGKIHPDVKLFIYNVNKALEEFLFKLFDMAEQSMLKGYEEKIVIIKNHRIQMLMTNR